MKGLVENLYNFIALLHPRIEVKLRQLYWYNNKRLSKFNPNKTNLKKNTRIETSKDVNFDDILNQLRLWGVKEGCVLVVHSSYDSLSATGLSPLEIISRLRDLIGKSGTLAMPLIRYYKEEPDPFMKLSKDYLPPRCKYNPRRTPVTSGLLPTLLMRFPDAEISLHPLNSMCAIGPKAKEMMKCNIDGILPSPHGPKSSWKYCLDQNAIVIGLGTDLRHHNTMGHVAEEAFGDWYWPDDQWYNEREFLIEKSKEESIVLRVKERKPTWGMLHQAEMNRYSDFLKNNIIKSKKFGSILLEMERSQELIKFLREKNKKGYPYFI